MTESVLIHEAVIKKLYPKRFPGMSGVMSGILGVLLGEEWSEPGIDDLVITSDGYLLAQNTGDVGFNHFIGLYADFHSNIEKLVSIKEVGLTEEEIKYIWHLVAGIRRA